MSEAGSERQTCGGACTEEQELQWRLGHEVGEEDGRDMDYIQEEAQPSILDIKAETLSTVVSAAMSVFAEIYEYSQPICVFDSNATS